MLFVRSNGQATANMGRGPWDRFLVRRRNFQKIDPRVYLLGLFDFILRRLIEIDLCLTKYG